MSKGERKANRVRLESCLTNKNHIVGDVARDGGNQGAGNRKSRGPFRFL